MAKKKNQAVNKEPQLVSIEELRPDDKNANKGTARGMSMLEDSLRNYGAGRSVLVDRNNRVIAGNKTQEAAADVGIEEVIVVETEGDELIAVQRMDLDMDEDPRARQLGLADNRVGEVNLEWDRDVLNSLQDTGVDLRDYWNNPELDRLLKPTISIPEGDETPDIPPPVMGEEKLDSTHIRMVQLFFTDLEGKQEFEKLVEELAAVFNTETTTDTVWQALLAADEQVVALGRETA